MKRVTEKMVGKWILDRAKDENFRFYASDVAEDLDVDVFRVMDVLDSMRKKGKVRKVFEE